jgi:ABC-type Zn uptake system ZnuABC Zn-binding protein ZnuA
MGRGLARAVLCGVVVLGALASPAGAQERLRVVTTLPDLWAITRAIVGDAGDVQVATRPGQNPHDMEIRPSQVLLVRRAEVLVRNGLDEDSWIDPIVEGSGNPRLLRGSPSVIEASRGVALLKVHTGPVDRSLGDVHPSGNPHFTLDPGTMPVVTANIVGGLARLRPDLEARLEANRREFLSRVEAALRGWRDRLAPFRGTRLVSYHDSWPYFYRAFDLIEAGIVENRPGVPPTPQHVISLVRQMKEQRIGAVLVENWYPLETAAAVARQAGVPLLVLPQSPGAVRGTEDYVAHLEHLVSALVRTLGGK